jgi:hypothetical protein
MATSFTGKTIDTSSSSHLNNQISHGTEAIVVALLRGTRENLLITSKIRLEINGIIIHTMSIKIIITEICVKEELKTTEMLYLSRKITTDLKITELFPIEITTILTQEMEVIWDKKDLTINLRSNNAIRIFKLKECQFKAKATFENKMPGVSLKDLIEMGSILFSSARFRETLTNLLRSGKMILAKFVDPAPDPLPNLIFITEI